MDPLTVATSQLDELIARLTPRQMQVVELLVQGSDYATISNILSISRSRVKHHVWNACHKLEVENKTQLVVVYVVWRMKQP